MKTPYRVPVVDIFAGPGGLSEGFSAFEWRDSAPFQINLSIEKDPVACRTLRLRKFLRSFRQPPREYLAYTRGELTLEQLYRVHPCQRASNIDQRPASNIDQAVGVISGFGSLPLLTL